MTARRGWWLYIVAAATYLPVPGFYYVGEEAIFPVSSLEMWYHGEWVRQLLYGANLKHNPLFNWLIIPVASAVGWEHVLAVARAFTVSATVASGVVIGWLAHVLYRNTVFAALVALTYLTLADVFFYRGWLAYVDPLFTFFLTVSAACLWVACERRQTALLALAVAALTAAFMSKAFTTYAFYGAAAFVLMLRPAYRATLLAPASWAIHACGGALAAAWLVLVPSNAGQGGRMFAEIVAKLAPESAADYALKLIAYPLETLARLLPVAAVIAYFWWRAGRRIDAGADPHLRTVGWVCLLGYLPYWLAPQSSMRYLLPLYPLAGLLLARLLWLLGERAITAAQRTFVVLIVVKLVAVLVLFPWYQRAYRGENYAVAAREIQRHAGAHALYVTNVSASGLSVVAHLDLLRLPAAPLTFPPADWPSGFVIAERPDPKLGEVARHYRLGGDDLYLLCRGPACDAATR